MHLRTLVPQWGRVSSSGEEYGRCLRGPQIGQAFLLVLETQNVRGSHCNHQPVKTSSHVGKLFGESPFALLTVVLSPSGIICLIYQLVSKPPRLSTLCCSLVHSARISTHLFQPSILCSKLILEGQAACHILLSPQHGAQRWALEKISQDLSGCCLEVTELR